LPNFKKELQHSIDQLVPFRSEFRIKTNAKTFKHIRIFADVILDKQMKPVRLIGVNWDITERKGIEKRIIQAREKAEISDKLKSTFLANISHEIRTPIHGIIGFAQILKNGEIPDLERKQYLDIIINNGNNLMDTISNIIDISMLDAGQLKLTDKVCNLNDIVNDVYNSFMNSKIQGNKNFNFILDVDCDHELALVGDEFRLKQVFTNLLDNAFKFTNLGEVRMGYRLIENEYIFYVKDTGIGIKQEFIAKVFDRFKQAEEGYNRNYGGNGLGLSICRGLIELMGGKIWVEQNDDRGSAFFFTVPVKAPVETNPSYADKTNRYLN
jgi:signal transduction histidine kinase